MTMNTAAASLWHFNGHLILFMFNGRACGSCLWLPPIPAQAGTETGNVCTYIDCRLTLLLHPT